MFGQNFNAEQFSAMYNLDKKPQSQPQPQKAADPKISTFGQVQGNPPINPAAANNSRQGDSTPSNQYMQDFNTGFQGASFGNRQGSNFRNTMSQPTSFGAGFGQSYTSNYSSLGGSNLGLYGGFGGLNSGSGTNYGINGLSSQGNRNGASYTPLYTPNLYPAVNGVGNYNIQQPQSLGSKYGQTTYNNYQQAGPTSSLSNLGINQKVSDNYIAPPPQKPTPPFDNHQYNQIQSIMKQHGDIEKADVLDKAHLGKVIYSSALSSSSTSQKYKQLCDELARTGKQFTDQDFPCDKSSLAAPDLQHKYRDVASWKRAGEILKNPALYEDKIEPNDIMQGNLGDCYLLSTFAAIAEYPERIRKIFISQEYSKSGVYAISLVWRGANCEVIVDDYLPVDKRNEPYFLTTRGSELWVALLEKAWAKLHRNYDRIDGQLTKEALHDFTGAPVRDYRTNKDQNGIWKRIVEADKKGYIMTAGTEGTDVGDSSDPLKRQGLVSGHAYTLIGAFDVQQNNGQIVQLVQVRNPWGNFEWKGKWSDKDSNWNNISQAEKKRIGYSGDTDDGAFFLEYSTVLQHFDGIQICYYQNDYVYKGLEFRSSATESKYFEIKISKSGTYYFNLSQLTIRLFDDDYVDNGRHYSDAKFCIADTNGKPIQAFYGKRRDIYSCKYIDNPFQFQAGTYYAFAQVQWLKSATHSFGLGAYGPSEISLKEINKSQAGNLPNTVSPWEQNRVVQFETEGIYQV